MFTFLQRTAIHHAALYPTGSGPQALADPVPTPVARTVAAQDRSQFGLCCKTQATICSGDLLDPGPVISAT